MHACKHATYPGVVKAWHRHSKTKQIDNMCIIQGMAKIIVYDDRPNSPTKGTINEFMHALTHLN